MYCSYYYAYLSYYYYDYDYYDDYYDDYYYYYYYDYYKYYYHYFYYILLLLLLRLFVWLASETTSDRECLSGGCSLDTHAARISGMKVICLFVHRRPSLSACTNALKTEALPDG